MRNGNFSETSKLYLFEPFEFWCPLITQPYFDIFRYFSSLPWRHKTFPRYFVKWKWCHQTCKLSSQIKETILRMYPWTKLLIYSEGPKTFLASFCASNQAVKFKLHSRRCFWRLRKSASVAKVNRGIFSKLDGIDPRDLLEDPHTSYKLGKFLDTYRSFPIDVTVKPRYTTVRSRYTSLHKGKLYS